MAVGDLIPTNEYVTIEVVDSPPPKKRKKRESRKKKLMMPLILENQVVLGVEMLKPQALG